MITVEEVATFLAKIHKFPTEWYGEWREKMYEQWPVLREAPLGNHVWWFTARPDWIMG